MSVTVIFLCDSVLCEGNQTPAKVPSKQTDLYQRNNRRLKMIHVLQSFIADPFSATD